MSRVNRTYTQSSGEAIVTAPESSTPELQRQGTNLNHRAPLDQHANLSHYLPACHEAVREPGYQHILWTKSLARQSPLLRLVLPSRARRSASSSLPPAPVPRRPSAPLAGNPKHSVQFIHPSIRVTSRGRGRESNITRPGKQIKGPSEPGQETAFSAGG